MYDHYICQDHDKRVIRLNRSFYHSPGGDACYSTIFVGRYFSYHRNCLLAKIFGGTR